MISWNRKRNARDNHDDDQGAVGGELVPFPRRPEVEAGPEPGDPTVNGTVRADGGDGPHPGPDTSGDRPDPTPPEDGPSEVGDRVVLEGTVVPVDARDPRGGDWLAELHARRAQRRPVIPVWLRSWEQAAATGKWVVGYAAHVVAFHLVRTPLYAAKLLLRSPVGGFRLVRRVISWWWDLDGEAVRLATVTPKPDPETYLRLARHRDARVRGRTILLLAALALAAGVGLWGAMAAPEWSRWAALAAAVLLLGLGGGRADRPLVGPAVVPTRVQKLSAELVTRALGSLGIAQINQALARDGDGIAFPAPISRDGPGWRAEVDLPLGVTVTDILERRVRLASALRRSLGCVWPEPAPDAHAGRLVLWVGDQDMSKAKAPTWPLLRHGRADIFAPLPFGYDQRGRLVSVHLMFTSLLIGAMPRQGKTFALRVLLLAVALDPRVQLNTFELKGTGDLSPLAKVSHTYGSGQDDDTIAACVDMLRAQVVELGRRAKVISGMPKDLCPENKVTPDLASNKSLGLFPVVDSIDEAQELFTHPVYGKEAEELCLKLIKLGPAMGLHLVLATQRPDRDSLPPGISANMGLRFCLRVMGQVENDMVLGTSSYRNGTRATTFTSRDKGIGWLVGNSDEPQIVRSAYIDGPTADKIADRARALRANAGTLSGYAVGDQPEQTGRGYDLLADILSVLPATEDKAWSESVVERLADLRADVYAGWGAEQLAAALKPYGVPTGRQVWGKTADGRGANRRGIHRDDITKAVTHGEKKRGDGHG